MMANIARMQTQMNLLGVRFRPHVKTSKCIDVVQRQRAAGASGITVSTLKEAQQFFAAGFNDILYAVCMAPNKLAQALELRRRGCQLTVLVDSLASAHAVVAYGQAEQHSFEVMIEIDCDGHRSGVQPEAPELLLIGQILHQGSAKLKGVLTHAGSSYDLNKPEALRQMAEQERRLCVRAAQRLREANLPCAEVSVGSTPTALSATTLEGVTEVRAGVYVFFDLVMANIGVCSTQELALSVLTTVIGHKPDKGWALVDAGWMAMSRDRGTQKQAHDYGYGAVCDQDAGLLNGFVLTGANQEHGIVALADGSVASHIDELFPIGTRLRILPNHACATAAQFPQYQVLDAQGQVSSWERFYGW